MEGFSTPSCQYSFHPHQCHPSAGVSAEAVASAVIVPDIFKYTLAKAGFNEQHFLYVSVLYDAKLIFVLYRG